MVVPRADMMVRILYHDFHVIDEAIAPILARFERRNNWMPGPCRMLARVAIFRIIAASHMAARSAQA
jgi:hypothetical protein